MRSEAIFNIWNYIVLFGGTVIAVILWIIYKHTHSRPLLNSIPGIYTSLGLFGTFMAIVFSLGDIKEEDFSTIDTSPSTKIESVEMENLTVEEIVDLENGAKLSGDGTSHTNGTDNTIKIIQDLVPAFTSSILGLILALLATVVCKIKFAYEDKDIDEIVDKFTPEECLYEIMEQCKLTVSLLQSQDDKTKLYNEQLQNNIGEQNKILQTFIDDFVKKMGDIFDNMKSSITSQVESLGNVQLSKAEDILAEISKQLSSVTTQILDAQKDTVSDLVSSTNSQLQAMAQSVAAQYDLIQQNAKDNVASMTAIKEQFTITSQDMLSQAIDMNRQTVEDVKGSIQEMVVSIKESVNNECKTLNAAIEANVAALNKSYTFVKDRIAQITHDYEQAGLAFADAVTNSHRQNETTENTIKRANECLALLETTNENISELLKAFNDRQDNIETLVAHINELSSTIAVLQKLETQLKRLNK